MKAWAIVDRKTGKLQRVDEDEYDPRSGSTGELLVYSSEALARYNLVDSEMTEDYKIVRVTITAE